MHLQTNFGLRNAKHKEIYKGYQDILHTRGRLRTLYTNIFRSLPTEREGFFILTLCLKRSVQPKKTKEPNNESRGCRCHRFSGYQNVTGISRTKFPGYRTDSRSL